MLSPGVGTGNITLYWYVICCGFSGFVFIIASLLIVFGRRKEKKAREKRLRAGDKNP